MNATVVVQKARGLFANVAAHRKALSTSVLNQGVTSATNFALQFFLVRALSPEDYGTYGLGLALCYLYSGVGNALFLTRMVVCTPEKPHGDRIPYAGRVLAAVAQFSALTLLLAAAATWPAHALGYEGSAGLILAVAAASVSFLLKDFFVRQAYTDRTEGRALAVNMSMAACLVVLLAGLYATHLRLSAAGALAVFAASQLVGAAVGLVLAHLPLRVLQWRPLRGDAREWREHGRWALTGTAATWGQAQAYSYVTLWTVGTAGVGQANAARLLVAPFFLLVPAINQVMMPRLAQMRTRDPKGMVRLGRMVTAALVGLALLYCGAVLLGSEQVVPLMLGPRYSGMRPLVAVWCVVILATLLRDGAFNVMQVMKQFRSVTLTNAVSASVAVVAVWILGRAWGVHGAVLGTAVGELVLAGVLWRLAPRHAAAEGNS